jgi:N-acetylneuraminate lyase
MLRRIGTGPKMPRTGIGRWYRFQTADQPPSPATARRRGRTPRGHVMERSATEGLVAAPFTPLAADGSLRAEAIGPYAARLAGAGVVGAFVCGTTGEGVSLTVAERQEVAEHWVRSAPPGFRVFVHVGAASLADSRALAAHAAGCGAHGIACMAPFFFRPVGITGLVEWCAAVAAAAPRTPFYYYHIPSMTGVQVSVAGFLDEAGPRIPTLAGVKFTHDDLADLARCLAAASGRYDILFGRDERLVEAHRLGVRGAVGSTYNFAPRLFVDMLAAEERGEHDVADRLQADAVRLIEGVAACCAQPLPAFKRAMAIAGLECGPVRPPLVTATAEQGARIAAVLAARGLTGTDGVSRR